MAADDLKNVAISVLKNFEEGFGASYSIDLPDVELDKDGLTKWLEPRLLGESPVPTRQGERFEIWTLNVNCYARVGDGLEGIYATWDMAGAVRDRYSQQTIAVKDWDALGDPTVAYLRFGEAAVEPVPGGGGRDKTTQNLAQMNVRLDATLIV